MLFKSRYEEIEYPTDLTVWEWAFEDPKASPLLRFPRNEIAGFTNAVTGERIDFFQVKEHSTHLSTALIKIYGFKETDTVSLFSMNTIWYPVAMYAVLRAGGRVNGASPAYSVEEMTNTLRTAKSKYIMTVPNSIKVALAAAKNAGIPQEHIFLLEGELEGFTTMKQLLEIGKSYGIDGQTPVYRIPKGQNNDVCGFLTFSSGTTGLPKAEYDCAVSTAEGCCITTEEEILGQLAMLSYGLVRFLNWPIASNDECIMLPAFTMESFLRAIVKYKITDLTLVPAIVLRLVRDPIVNDYDLSSVRTIACGAAPVGQETLNELQKKMPWTGFRQSYGMTESCYCLTTHPPEFYNYKYANNGGMLLGSTVIKVVDVITGKELGPGETGELLAKGPQIAMGYLDNPKETAETFGASDGWLHTGDIGNVDEMGFIHIVDRIKEMIKVKGQQVAPAELEDLLLGHPHVDDCAVLGIPDEYSSERPKAYIVLKSHVQPSEHVGRALMAYVKENRVRYKWLKEVEYIDIIPKSPSSKILRRVLRDKEKRGERGFVIKDGSEKTAKL